MKDDISRMLNRQGLKDKATLAEEVMFRCLDV